MGLDTYVMRAKADTSTFLVKDEYGDNKVNDSIWKDCLYWRKCWGLDSYLSFHATDRVGDEYTAVIPFEVLEDLYNTVCDKISRVLKAVNNFKRFPFSNVETIDQLEDYDGAFECEDMYPLWDAIEEIAGETFTDSIWGAITALRTTYHQLHDIMAEPDAADYTYVWVSSF